VLRRHVWQIGGAAVNVSVMRVIAFVIQIIGRGSQRLLASTYLKIRAQ